MRESFSQIRDLLDDRERRQALALFAMMIMMGVLETIGVSSVMPFIAVLSEPSVIHSSPYFAPVYEAFDFSSTGAFLVFFGAVVFALLIGSLTFTAATNWAMARFANERNYTISARLLRGYLSQPYSFFLNRHSSELGKSMLSEVEQVVNWALIAGLKLVANAVVAICLVALLVFVDPVVAVSAVIVLGGTYVAIYLCVRHYVSRIGSKRVSANTARFRVAQEALNGIKDVKVLGLEGGYLRSFEGPARRYARAKANNQIVGDMPKYALQALMFGGMLLLLLGMLVAREGGLESVLPLAGLYVIAGARLIPALEKVYRALTDFRFGKPALDALHKDLLEIEREDGVTRAGSNAVLSDPIRLNDELRLDEVGYRYPGSTQFALKGLNLRIPAHATVALVGGTGAGKTTVVDIILGLLTPQEGRLLVDGAVVEGALLRGWQRNIGYVSQSIFLSDDTVSANIAFGVPVDEIDQEAVERASRTAELHEFVTGELPDGYDTEVGERGVRLSGGQRQRVAIARAVYHDPDVLILDEATSALDNKTEKAVIDAVHNLERRKTIIMVAHRLSTVKKCDRVFVLDKGAIVAEGTYTELVSNSKQFRVLAAGAA